MIEKQLQTILSDLAEQKAPSTGINLWPAIQTRLAHSRLQTSDPTQPRGNIMNTRKQPIQRLRLAALIILASVSASALFFTTPQGRALAQEILHFFTRSTSNTLPGAVETTPVWVAQTPGLPAATLTPLPAQPGPAFEADCGGYGNPKCAIEQIRGRVTFPVFQLAQIPEGLYFGGATGGPDRIQIIYKTKNQSGILLLSEEAWMGSLEQKAWEVGASADIQAVKVGEAAGEYVKGSYFSDGGPEPAVWTPDIDVQHLRWVDEGVLFGLQKLGPEPQMDRNALVALAESLTADPAADTPPILAEEPTADPAAALKERFSLSVEQAGQQAGFTLHLPAQLPDLLSLLGARYEAELEQVSTFYLFDQSRWGPNSDGLTVSQQAVPQSGGCPLCGFLPGAGTDIDPQAPGKVVGKDAGIETVKVGAAAGQYVEGNWQGTDCCGWSWAPDPYFKRLRWQAGGMAYELAYMGMSITKEDMITIAESMR